MSSDEDNFFDTPEAKHRSRWALAAFAVITLLVVGLPLIWAFTGWL
ncbi:MAG TPA: hypothetical protein VMT74_04860 [Gaiellaceae bacterium]|nr:hypothetical protein [Gaiellaceae bacterium]